MGRKDEATGPPMYDGETSRKPEQDNGSENDDQQQDQSR